MIRRLFNSIGYSFVIVFASSLTIIISFLIQIFKNSISFSDLFVGGELIIICISLLVNTLYYLKNYRNDQIMPNIIFWLAFLFYTLGLIIFILLVLFIQAAWLQDFLVLFSLLLFAFVFCTTTYTYFIQNTEDVLKTRKKNVDKLEKCFDSLRGEQ